MAITAEPTHTVGANLAEWRHHVHDRVHRQFDVTGDAELGR